MKKNATKSLSINAKRELEVLSHYYQVDYEKQVVTIPAHFHKASEIILNYIGDKKHPVIVDGFLEDLSKISHSIPAPFQVSVSLTIDDYEGYSHNAIMNSMQDALEVFNYNIKKQRNVNHIKMSLLIAAGVVIFAWLFYVCSFKFFEEEETLHNTIHEIIYTIACVLLWEGVYILFLPEQKYESVSFSILQKIKEIALKDKKGKVLVKRSLEELKEDWVHEGKWQRRCRSIFLITSTGYLCLALCGLPGIITLFLATKDSALNLCLAILSTGLALLLCLTSFSTLSYYNGTGPFKRFVLPLNIASLSIIAINLSLYITNLIVYKQTSIFWLVSNSILMVIASLGIWGAIILSRKRNKK